MTRMVIVPGTKCCAISRPPCAPSPGPVIPARLGGDEFVVLLHDCAPIDAMQVAERVRLHLLEAARQATPGIEFSVSIGIAATPRGGSVEDWLALADRALYHAKRQGKNNASYGE